jgi:Fic family protein
LNDRNCHIPTHTAAPTLISFVRYVERIDTLEEYVDKTRFFRHVSLTCRLDKHTLGIVPRPQNANTWRPTKPYNEIPHLPPRADLETRVLLKACIGARAAIAELKQAAELIPDQGILINTLPLLEAQASSEIENVITTTDRLFEFREAEESADPATKEALRYGHALLEGFQLLRNRPLVTRTAEEICTLIKGREMRVRKVPGTALARRDEIVYTPPVGEELLRNLLANWERYMNEPSGVDPLIRMAVGHYQFEAIHPFTDGNGRTGRVLNSLFLISEGLLTLPILYLSRYIIGNKADYYHLLRSVTREEAWEDWTLFVLRGVEETARWTVDKIASVRKLHAATADYVREHSPKIYSHELISLIFERPYCRIQNVTARGIAGRQTASVYLKELVKIGILKEKAVGREKLFVNPKLMQLLTREV